MTDRVGTSHKAGL